MEPFSDEAADVLVGQVAAGRRLRVVDSETADVAVRARRLDRQELRVEARELQHVRLPLRVRLSIVPFLEIRYLTGGAIRAARLRLHAEQGRGRGHGAVRIPSRRLDRVRDRG